MNILIVSSTHTEVNQVFQSLNVKEDKDSVFSGNLGNKRIDILISGIGVYATLYNLLRKVNLTQYDLILGIGIAGSYKDNISIGDIVHVISEEIGDLGIEGGENFHTLFDMNYVNKDETPFSNGILRNPNLFQSAALQDINQVKGLTCNTVHGNKKSITKIKTKFDADIETMEGAALFYACIVERVPFLEIRAISNYVAERDASKWDIKKATDNLGSFLIKFLNSI